MFGCLVIRSFYYCPASIKLYFYCYITLFLERNHIWLIIYSSFHLRFVVSRFTMICSWSLIHIDLMQFGCIKPWYGICCDVLFSSNETHIFIFSTMLNWIRFGVLLDTEFRIRNRCICEIKLQIKIFAILIKSNVIECFWW